VQPPVRISPTIFVHPENTLLSSGAAVRVTCVPGRYARVQVVPQSMPEPPETDPAPVPDLVTVRLTVARASKLAWTTVSATIVKVHVVAVPVHAPPQPPKCDTSSDAAVSGVEACRC